MGDDTPEMIRVTGLVSLEVDDTWQHHQWTGEWPPPEHLAVAHVRAPGRDPLTLVMDVAQWVDGTTLVPHATVAWMYDRISASTLPDPVDLDPDEGHLVMRAAVYRRSAFPLATSNRKASPTHEQ
jgi:hypothetical protein